MTVEVPADIIEAVTCTYEGDNIDYIHVDGCAWHVYVHPRNNVFEGSTADETFIKNFVRQENKRNQDDYFERPTAPSSEWEEIAPRRDPSKFATFWRLYLSGVD